MSSMVRTFLAAAALLVPAGAQTAGRAADEQAILQAAHAAREASRAGDVARLEPMLTDDFLAIDPSGQVRNKAAFVEMIRNIPPGMREANAQLKIAQRDVRVRQYGDVAVLTERRDVEGAPEPSRARYTQVWLKDRGQWRITTFQVTRIAAAGN